jgi:hypothetical protein
MTIIRELVLSLVKVIIIHSVKYVVICYVVVWQHAAACCQCFNIPLARLCTSSLMMVIGRNM